MFRISVLRSEWRRDEAKSVHDGADHRGPEGARGAGLKLAELARKHGVTEHTIYRWKAKYGGMDVSDAQRLKQLEDENRRLKHMVADQALDIQALKAVLGKKW